MRRFQNDQIMTALAAESFHLEDVMPLSVLWRHLWSVSRQMMNCRMPTQTRRIKALRMTRRIAGDGERNNVRAFRRGGKCVIEVRAEMRGKFGVRHYQRIEIGRADTWQKAARQAKARILAA